MGISKCWGKGIKALQDRFDPCFPLHLFLFSPQPTSVYKMTLNFSLKILDKSIVLYMEKYSI